MPAAEAVGPKGKVVAVDLAERLVRLGEAKTRAKRLSTDDPFAGWTGSVGSEQEGEPHAVWC